MKFTLLIFLTSSFLLFTYSLHAQKFQVDLAAGYGIAMTPTYQTTGISKLDQMSQTKNYALKSERYSFNEGWTGHVKVNYYMNQTLFLTVGARYQKGKRSYDPYIEDYGWPNTLYSEESKTIEFEQLDTQIGLGLRKNISDRLSLYLSHGFTFFVYGKSRMSTTTISTSPAIANDTRSRVVEEKPEFTFGAYGDVGLVYQLSKHVDLLFNVTLQAKNWSSKSARLTEYTIGGVDQLPGMTTSQLESEYESTVETNSEVPTNPNAPSKALKSWRPNSGAEAVLGIRFNFGGAPKHKDTVDRKSALYIQGAFGYGMPLSELTSTSYETVFENVSFTSTSKSTSKLFSYGKGLSYQLLLGYYFGKGLSTEIGAVFNTSKVTSSYSFHSVGSTESNVEYRNSAWMLRNTYGIKLESQFPKLNAFVRTGLSLGFGKLSKYTESTWIPHYDPNQPTEVTKTTEEFSGNVSLGGYLGLGTSLKVGRSIVLIAEAITYTQNWSPKRSQLSQYDINDVDQLDGISTYSQEVNYVSELNDNDWGFDPNVPREQLRTVEPFSTFVITVGLRYYFGK